MERPPRAAPLRYSAPSTARFVILILAVLCLGLFVGNSVHNVVEGERWGEEVAACDAGTAGAELFERQRAFEACTASVERTRTGYSAAGALVSLISGVAVAVIAPVVIRRRRGLRPLPATLDAARQRVEELAAAEHVRRPPRVLMGRVSQRDAFTFGLPGAYRIVLPPKLALKASDRAVFDPIVLHELAHVAHHDVALAWLARGVWLAVVPLACVPLILAVAGGDLSTMADYVPRAAVILVVVRLVANEVLRVREHEADVAVGRNPAYLPGMLALLSTMREKDASHLWSRLGAQHPTPARRVRVLEDPTAMLQPTILEGFTAALLAATIQPLLQALVTTALTGSGSIAWSAPVAALVTGVLLGGSVGVGLWRASVYCRVSQRRVRYGGLAVAVGCGLAAGQLLSLAQVSVAVTPVGSVTSTVLWLVAGIGATLLAAGAGSLWADLAPRIRQARVHRLAALATGTLVFALALWGGNFVGMVVSWAGWPQVLVAVGGPQPGAMAGVLLLALAAAIPLVLTRAGRPAPTWAADTDQTWSWPVGSAPRTVIVLFVAVASGLGGAVAIWIFRGMVGPAASDIDGVNRLFDYALVAGAAGVVSAVILGVSHGTRGAAAGLVSMPVAAIVTTVGYVAMSAALGTFFTPAILLQFLDTALVAGILGGVALAPVTLLAPPPAPAASGVRTREARRRLVVVSVVAFACAAIVVAPIPFLRPSSSVIAPPDGASGDISEQLYLQVIRPPLARDFNELVSVSVEVDAAGLDPRATARRIRSDLLPIVGRLEVTAAQYDPPTTELRDVHAFAEKSIEAYRRGLSGLADAYDAGDEEAARSAASLVDEAFEHLTEWLAAATALDG